MRLGAVQAGSGGAASFAVDYTALPANGQITSGSTWHFQYWYRDAVPGGSGSNLSNGLSLSFCP